MSRAVHPPCAYKKTDCAAYVSGKCVALSDTRFKDKERCSFYKNHKQNAAERVACRERLKAKGLGGLTEKYERVEGEKC